MKWWLLLLVVGGWAHAAEVDRSAFAYDAASAFDGRTTLVAEQRAFTVYDVRYPSPMTTAFPTNNVVHSLYYRPKGNAGRKFPAVIVLHILQGPNGLSIAFAEHFARHGIAALHLVMPFYGERADGQHRLLSNDVNLTVQSVRQAVMDIRRGRDWLARQPEIDGQHIGVTGISLGAELGCLAFCSDSQFRAAVLVLGGGDLAKVLTASELTIAHRRQMKELGLTCESLSRDFAPIEPLRYARGVHRRADVLMFNAHSDEVMLPECADALWQALDQPVRYWLYAGHYTAIIYIADVMDKATEFFQQKFSSP